MICTRCHKLIRTQNMVGDGDGTALYDAKQFRHRVCASLDMEAYQRLTSEQRSDLDVWMKEQRLTLLFITELQLTGPLSARVCANVATQSNRYELWINVNCTAAPPAHVLDYAA